MNPSVGLNFGQFQATVKSFVRIETITAPRKAGWYVFDYDTYSGNGDFLESGAATATLTASELAALTVDALHYGTDLPSGLVVEFRTSKDLGSGEKPSETLENQAFIELVLPVAELSFPIFRQDLGAGLAVGSLVACQAESGISYDSELRCEITEDEAKVVILVTEFNPIPAGAEVKIVFPGISYLQNQGTATLSLYEV